MAVNKAELEKIRILPSKNGLYPYIKFYLFLDSQSEAPRQRRVFLLRMTKNPIPKDGIRKNQLDSFYHFKKFLLSCAKNNKNNIFKFHLQNFSKKENKTTPAPILI